MRVRLSILAIVLLLGAAMASVASAQGANAENAPFPPFRIVGNLYYVGTADLASYLVVTPRGNILINSDLESTLPILQANIRKLGFKFAATKILLISHAHWDHDAGSAKIKQLTGARYMVMDADVPVVESGGRADFHYGREAADLYPPAKVDRVLHDGDKVTLGGSTLVAHLTPGHTKGCTTWTMRVKDGSQFYNVVIVGSPNVNPGYQLVGNAAYPRIAEDYERMWRTLHALPCDIFLGAHAGYFGLQEKFARRNASPENPFVDPEGYKNFVSEKEQAFRAELARQKRRTD